MSGPVGPVQPVCPMLRHPVLVAQSPSTPSGGRAPAKRVDGPAPPARIQIADRQSLSFSRSATTAAAAAVE